MIFPSGVKHGNCPCSTARKYSSRHAAKHLDFTSVGKASALTIMIVTVETLSSSPSVLAMSAHLLKEEELCGVQAKVLVLDEMLLGGCVCGRTGHDIPPDWMPA